MQCHVQILLKWAKYWYSDEIIIHIPDKKIVKMFEKSYSEGMITLSIFILMPQIACFRVIWYYLEKIVDFLKLRELKPSGEVPKL